MHVERASYCRSRSEAPHRRRPRAVPDRRRAVTTARRHAVRRAAEARRACAGARRPAEAPAPRRAVCGALASSDGNRLREARRDQRARDRRSSWSSRTRAARSRLLTAATSSTPAATRSRVAAPISFATRRSPSSTSGVEEGGVGLDRRHVVARARDELGRRRISTIGFAWRGAGAAASKPPPPASRLAYPLKVIGLQGVDLAGARVSPDLEHG